jgi:hypothetical protein
MLIMEEKAYHLLESMNIDIFYLANKIGSTLFPKDIVTIHHL